MPGPEHESTNSERQSGESSGVPEVLLDATLVDFGAQGQSGA